MTEEVRKLADALLYEGYLLYPYRPSALKNQHRYPFGTLYPEAFCRAQEAEDAWALTLECVALGSSDARISGQLRFLQLLDGGAAAREAFLPPTSLAALADGRRVAFGFSSLRGELLLKATPAADGTSWKLVARLRNLTPLADAERVTRDEALCDSMASTHLLLRSERGQFVSLIDPDGAPQGARELVKSCRNDALWPVLVGRPAARDTLLAAPIILYDYPAVAPESPGDFFDGTEIDELLSLRVMTLTDDEKREMSTDSRARALLERTEACGLERLEALHGRLQRASTLQPGAAVRLRPKGRADIFDIALAGRRATIEAIEHDFEGRTYVAVTVDDDPGRDLGAYGHRFFFRPEEVELL